MASRNRRLRPGEKLGKPRRHHPRLVNAAKVAGEIALAGAIGAGMTYSCIRAGNSPRGDPTPPKIREQPMPFVHPPAKAAPTKKAKTPAKKKAPAKPQRRPDKKPKIQKDVPNATLASRRQRVLRTRRT